MDLLEEEKDKNVFLDCLDQIISYDFTEIIFSLKPIQKELMKYTHPMFRLMMMVDGEHGYKILDNDGVRDIKLHPGQTLFCQRRGVTGPPIYEDVVGKMFTIVFFPQYIRFLISNCKRLEENSLHFWYHSSHAVSQAGIHVLKALDELSIVNDSGVNACLLVKTLLNICRDNLIDDSPQNITKSFRTYQSIKAYLHENANKNINRKSIAKVFKLNPSHISKLFAVHDEHSFNYVLKTLRLEHAVELLKDTTLSIDEITEQCGFVNTSYFIKTFRLFYGRSPGAFRQSKK